jgi:hypothetical protein
VGVGICSIGDFVGCSESKGSPSLEFLVGVSLLCLRFVIHIG